MSPSATTISNVGTPRSTSSTRQSSTQGRAAKPEQQLVGIRAAAMERMKPVGDSVDFKCLAAKQIVEVEQVRIIPLSSDKLHTEVSAIVDLGADDLPTIGAAKCRQSSPDTFVGGRVDDEPCAFKIFGQYLVRDAVDVFREGRNVGGEGASCNVLRQSLKDRSFRDVDIRGPSCVPGEVVRPQQIVFNDADVIDARAQQMFANGASQGTAADQSDRCEAGRSRCPPEQLRARNRVGRHWHDRTGVVEEITRNGHIHPERFEFQATGDTVLRQAEHIGKDGARSPDADNDSQNPSPGGVRAFAAAGQNVADGCAEIVSHSAQSESLAQFAERAPVSKHGVCGWCQCVRPQKQPWDVVTSSPAVDFLVESGIILRAVGGEDARVVEHEERTVVRVADPRNAGGRSRATLPARRRQFLKFLRVEECPFQWAIGRHRHRIPSIPHQVTRLGVAQPRAQTRHHPLNAPAVIDRLEADAGEAQASRHVFVDGIEVSHISRKVAPGTSNARRTAADLADGIPSEQEWLLIKEAVPVAFQDQGLCFDDEGNPRRATGFPHVENDRRLDHAVRSLYARALAHYCHRNVGQRGVHALLLASIRRRVRQPYPPPRPTEDEPTPTPVAMAGALGL